MTKITKPTMGKEEETSDHKEVPNCGPKGSSGEMDMEVYSEVNVPEGWGLSENVYNAE